MIRPLLAAVALGSFASVAFGGLGCAAPVADDGAASSDSALTQTDQAGGRVDPRAGLWYLA